MTWLEARVVEIRFKSISDLVTLPFRRSQVKLSSRLFIRLLREWTEVASLKPNFSPYKTYPGLEVRNL